jgi:5'-3' exonuclease
MTGQHLLLVDASGFAYRAFATSNPVHRESDGEPIGAILGFMSMMWRMRGAAETDNPTHGVAVFDAPGQNFRHKLFPAYKANRPAARAVELSKQLVIMRSAADVLGFTPIERAGYEADDVIATLAHRARKAGMRVTIISSDKDFGQCVEDGHIEIVDPMAKRRILAADVEAKFGVPPALVPIVQALAGDAVDGIPGIPGCGLYKAGRLVRRFGDLESILKNAKFCNWPQVGVELKRKADDARLFLKLTTLRRNVPVKFDFETAKLGPVLRSHLMEIMRALEAEPRFEAIFNLDPKTTRVVEPVKDALAWWKEELKFPKQQIPPQPQCGFYQRRFVKGGVFVAARIWREPETDPVTGKSTGMDVLHCQVGDRACDPVAEWGRLAMNPVAQGAHDFEVADAAHAKRYRPGDPKAAPTKPIDLIAAKAPHNPKPLRRMS